MSLQARITSDTQDIAKTHVDSKKKREKVSTVFFVGYTRVHCTCSLLQGFDRRSQYSYVQ